MLTSLIIILLHSINVSYTILTVFVFVGLRFVNDLSVTAGELPAVYNVFLICK